VENMKFKEKIENEKKIILREYPYSTAIEVSAHCNLRCVMCDNPTMKRKKGNMSLELFKKIVNEMKEYTQTRFYLNGYGEPLVNKDVFEFVRYATECGFTNSYMNTNAMLLDEDAALQLIKGGLHCLVVSIDGYEKETYESIRVGGDRDIVYKNVTRYLELLKEYGKENQIVEVQLIEMEKTLPEKEIFIDYWTSKGAYVKLKPLLSWGEVRDDEIETYEDRLACGACNMLSTSWDGKVPYCACGDNEETLSIGDANNENMLEIWERKKKIFSNYHINHEFHKLPEFCQKCPDWASSFAKHLDESKKQTSID